MPHKKKEYKVCFEKSFQVITVIIIKLLKCQWNDFFKIPAYIQILKDLLKNSAKPKYTAGKQN